MSNNDALLRAAQNRARATRPFDINRGLEPGDVYRMETERAERETDTAKKRQLVDQIERLSPDFKGRKEAAGPFRRPWYEHYTMAQLAALLDNLQNPEKYKQEAAAAGSNAPLNQ